MVKNVVLKKFSGPSKIGVIFALFMNAKSVLYCIANFVWLWWVLYYNWKLEADWNGASQPRRQSLQLQAQSNKLAEGPQGLLVQNDRCKKNPDWGHLSALCCCLSPPIWIEILLLRPSASLSPANTIRYQNQKCYTYHLLPLYETFVESRDERRWIWRRR